MKVRRRLLLVIVADLCIRAGFVKDSIFEDVGGECINIWECSGVNFVFWKSSGDMGS